MTAVTMMMTRTRNHQRMIQIMMIPRNRRRMNIPRMIPEKIPGMTPVKIPGTIPEIIPVTIPETAAIPAIPARKIRVSLNREQ